MMNAFLLAAALGGAAIAAAGVIVFRPGPAAQARSQPVGTGALRALLAEDTFLRIAPPTPSAENTDLVPHAAPTEAAAIAAEFFARPAPSDAELAAMTPFDGTENIRVQFCGHHWPKAATDELSLTRATPRRRMKDEIYARLNVQKALSTGDCTCAGKVAPFEPVALILDEILRRHGAPTGNLFYEYSNETRRLRSAVERLCNGRF
jgi:hypothetical protein